MAYLVRSGYKTYFNF